MSNSENNISSKIEKLDEKIKWFYDSDFSLEEALGNYKAAKSLAEEIKSDLESLKNEITILK